MGGTLAGLPGNARLVLLDNGGDALTLTANGPFRFATPVAFNTGYAVTVGQQPIWSDCKVAGGAGTATAEVGNVSVSCTAAAAQVTTLAGSASQGWTDGNGSTASFAHAVGIAVDAEGSNIYVADTDNNAIRKITSAGNVTTLAGRGDQDGGYADGSGSTALFSRPTGVAVDLQDNVFVADGGNVLIRKITQGSGATVSTVAGARGTPGSTDGDGTNAALFDAPFSVAADADGNVYVADLGNNAVRKITPDGTVTTLAGSGAPASVDGIGTAASFDALGGLAVDADGNVYVVENASTGSGNAIRKISPSGLVSTLFRSASGNAVDGAGPAAALGAPFTIAVDAKGRLYVTDLTEIRVLTPVH